MSPYSAVQPPSPHTKLSLAALVSWELFVGEMRSFWMFCALPDVPQMKRSGVVAVTPAAMRSARGTAQSMK